MNLVRCNRLAIGSTGSLHFPLINMTISKAESRFYKLEVERCLQTQSQGEMIQTSMTWKDTSKDTSEETSKDTSIDTSKDTLKDIWKVTLKYTSMDTWKDIWKVTLKDTSMAKFV